MNPIIESISKKIAAFVLAVQRQLQPKNDTLHISCSGVYLNQTFLGECTNIEIINNELIFYIDAYMLDIEELKESTGL